MFMKTFFKRIQAAMEQYQGGYGYEPYLSFKSPCSQVDATPSIGQDAQPGLHIH